MIKLSSVKTVFSRNPSDFSDSRGGIAVLSIMLLGINIFLLIGMYVFWEAPNATLLRFLSIGFPASIAGVIDWEMVEFTNKEDK